MRDEKSGKKLRFPFLPLVHDTNHRQTKLLRQSYYSHSTPLSSNMDYIPLQPTVQHHMWDDQSTVHGGDRSSSSVTLHAPQPQPAAPFPAHFSRDEGV